MHRVMKPTEFILLNRIIISHCILDLNIVDVISTAFYCIKVIIIRTEMGKVMLNYFSIVFPAFVNRISDTVSN